MSPKFTGKEHQLMQEPRPKSESTLPDNLCKRDIGRDNAHLRGVGALNVTAIDVNFKERSTILSMFTHFVD